LLALTLTASQRISMSSTAAIRHLPRLDSLRGIAAVMVAAYHAVGFYAIPYGIVGKFLGILIDGRIAVSIFFVLSGLVLGMSLRRSGVLTPSNYANFCVRRFFRLYPAYFVCSLPYLFALFILISRVHQGKFIGVGHFNEHFDVYGNSFPTTWELAKNFMFCSQTLNAVTWTLKVEAFAALILPLLHFYSYLTGWKGQLVMLLALLGLSFTFDENTRMELYLFYCGYLLPPALKHLNSIQLFKERTIFTLAFAASVTALIAWHTFPFTKEGAHPGIFFACLGSFLLLGLVMSDRNPHSSVFGILDHPVFRFYGAISYSFYLINVFCLDAAQRFFSWIPATAAFIPHPTLFNGWLTFALSFCLATALASFSYYFVEKPFIKIGARFYKT
jgi:peptidoglycan/LPS O-acetylase OafA/YrhL